MGSDIASVCSVFDWGHGSSRRGIIDVHGNRDKFDASRRSFGTRAFVLGAGYVVRHVHVVMAVQAQQSELERYAASQGALRLHLLTQSATGFLQPLGMKFSIGMKRRSLFVKPPSSSICVLRRQPIYESR